MNLWLPGGRKWEGIVGGLGMEMDNKQESLGRMGRCMCVAESLCCPLATVTTLLIGYTPKQNKKFSKKE